MSVEGTRRRGAAGTIWAMLALALWLSGAPPVRAQVRPASDPIVSSRLRRIVEMIPGSPLDLPPYLAKPQDVYLLVTAGASYTDIQVLANPEVPPPSVARALSSALAGTPLRGQPVEWSADRYSAAQVSEHHSRFGAVRGSNTVPIAPLVSGLRQAGLMPHVLLRIPRYAQVSVPSSHYGTKTFRWYDAKHLGGQASVTVTAALSPLSLAGPLSFLLVVPVIGLLGLWLAGVLSRRGQRDDAARRQVFRSVSGYATAGAVLLLFAGEFALFRSPAMSVLADLWTGSSATTTIFFPFLVASALILPLLLVVSHKQENRRFGPLPTAPAIPMSDEEKAVRQRVARYSMIPHLIGAVALGAVPFFVTRTSPLYPFIHPIAMFLPIVGAGLVGRIFQKRLDRFTQKTIDQDLTWRARQLGQTLGVRMPDVFVEDSSRAAHLAFASHQGHHITLSRKLQETFTPAETDFVLAHHLACMKRRPTLGTAGLMLLVLFLPLVALPAILIWGSMTQGASGTSLLSRFQWFFPVSIIYLLVSTTVLVPLLVKSSTRRQVKQNAEADRDALEVTGNLAAAESVLDKLEVDSTSAVVRTNSGYSSLNTSSAERMQAAHLLLRKVALQKTAQALGLAPSMGPDRNATG
jgi:Zn-dependent protease with chaperone function